MKWLDALKKFLSPEQQHAQPVSRKGNIANEDPIKIKSGSETINSNRNTQNGNLKQQNSKTQSTGGNSVLTTEELDKIFADMNKILGNIQGSRSSSYTAPNAYKVLTTEEVKELFANLNKIAGNTQTASGSSYTQSNAPRMPTTEELDKIFADMDRIFGTTQDSNQSNYGQPKARRRLTSEELDKIFADWNKIFDNTQGSGSSKSTYTKPKAQSKRKKNTSVAKNYDHIFEQIRKAMNKRVIGQSGLISDLIAAYKQGYRYRKQNGARNVILLMGHAGTGKDTALKVLVNQLYEHNLACTNMPIEIDLSRYDEKDRSGSFIADMSRAFYSGEGTVVFSGFNKADSFIISFIVQLAIEGSFYIKEGMHINASGYFLIFYIDYPITDKDKHGKIPDKLRKQIPEALLQGIRTVAISQNIDYDHMVAIVEYLVKDAINKLAELLQCDITIDNGVYFELADIAIGNQKFGEAIQEWIEQDLMSALSNMRARNEIDNNSKVRIVSENKVLFIMSKTIKSPIQTGTLVQEETVRKQTVQLNKIERTYESDRRLPADNFGIGEKETFNLEHELAEIVGLTKVKAFIRELEKQLVVDKRRKEGGIPVNSGGMIHIIFTGNPGTGKRTMARLLANLMKAKGYLKKGHLVEAGRSDLVAENIEQTASKVKKTIEAALDGVLFIDEASALLQDGVHDGSYGKETIDILVKAMDDYRDCLVVILAGLDANMEYFLDQDTRLRSRFPNIITFADYDVLELVQISRVMLQAQGYQLDYAAELSLRSIFAKNRIRGNAANGNGRMVRNLIEKALRAQALRLKDKPAATTAELVTLIAEDFSSS